MSHRTCSVDGCQRPHDAKGFCHLHYRRWCRLGDPLGRPVPLGRATFERLLLLETDEHVLWPLGRSEGGYGQVRIDGTSYYTHREALVRRRPMPGPGLLACHQPGIGCQRNCMNYRHLRWDTVAGNNADMVLDGTLPLGQKHWKSLLDEAKVREMRSLSRSGMTQQAIADQFGVHLVTAHKAIHGHTWGWVV